MHSPILDVQHLSKVYTVKNHTLEVLKDISFRVPRGGTFSIAGPSGSGKTTLLGLCAGLDNITAGSVNLNGNALEALSEDERAVVRNEHVGFIFQNFQLIPSLTALENVMVPIELQHRKNAKAIAGELLSKVGLHEREGHYPAQLSGGEQQRVSLARAFANQPSVLFADEPTGNLDDETGQKVIDLMFSLNREQGTSLVIVTHDRELAAMTDQRIAIKGGKIVES